MKYVQKYIINEPFTNNFHLYALFKINPFVSLKLIELIVNEAFENILIHGCNDSIKVITLLKVKVQNVIVGCGICCKMLFRVSSCE